MQSTQLYANAPHTVTATLPTPQTVCLSLNSLLCLKSKAICNFAKIKQKVSMERVALNTEHPNETET
jgi:hypothetical protein